MEQKGLADTTTSRTQRTIGYACRITSLSISWMNSSTFQVKRRSDTLPSLQQVRNGGVSGSLDEAQFKTGESWQSIIAFPDACHHAYVYQLLLFTALVRKLSHDQRTQCNLSTPVAQHQAGITIFLLARHHKSEFIFSCHASSQQEHMDEHILILQQQHLQWIIMMQQVKTRYFKGQPGQY